MYFNRLVDGVKMLELGLGLELYTSIIYHIGAQIRAGYIPQVKYDQLHSSSMQLLMPSKAAQLL